MTQSVERRFLMRRIDQQPDPTYTGVLTAPLLDVYTFACSVESPPYTVEAGTRKFSRYIDQILVVDPDTGELVPRFTFAYAHDSDWKCKNDSGTPGNPPLERANGEQFYVGRLIDGDSVLPTYAVTSCSDCPNKCCMRPEESFPSTFNVTALYSGGGTACGDGVVIPVTLDTSTIICEVPLINCPFLGAIWKGFVDPFQVWWACNYVGDVWYLKCVITNTPVSDAVMGAQPAQSPDSGQCSPYFWSVPTFTPSQGSQCYNPPSTVGASYSFEVEP